MITQKQMRLWIPKAQAIFKKYMPVDTLPGAALPPIYIGGPRNILKLRAELVEKTKSHQVNAPEEYNSIMEMIHGDAGDAILIQQKLVHDGNMAYIHFSHALWHEFGHYFAIMNESDTRDEYGASALYRFYDPGLSEDQRGQQEGYWFWSEFIAECIANHVDEQHRSIDNAEFYHPEKMVWEPYQWGSCSDNLFALLDDAFNYYNYTIDESSLAQYFAALLTNDLIKLYVKAADEGQLLAYDDKAIRKGNSEATRLMEAGSIDPTCISDIPDIFRDTLWDMKNILEGQLQKEEFWKIDEDFLEEIGGCILQLMKDKLIWLASNITSE